MLRLTPVFASLLFVAACDADQLSRIDATPRGLPPPIVKDEPTDIEEPATPTDPALTLSECAPSVLNGCTNPEEPSGMPATLPVPLGELPEACTAAAFIADNRAACGDVVDVEAGSAALVDVVDACTPGTLCRIQLPRGVSRFASEGQSLHCVYFVGDDDGTSSLELSGLVELQRVGLESLTIIGAGAGASVKNHTLFLDVDIVAESTGISVRDGDVKICASTVRAGYGGISFGNRFPAAGMLVSHSIVAGCSAGIELEGSNVEIADSIVQGTYNALDAREADNVLLRRSQFVSITYEVDTIEANATVCSDDVCGVDFGTCGERSIDFALPPVEPDTGALVPPFDVETDPRCEPRAVVEVAAAIGLGQVRAAGVETHEGANAGGQNWAWCVDTVRFVDNTGDSWSFDTGADSFYANAFSEPCDHELCGALHFADGVVMENICTVYVQCDGSPGGNTHASMVPGVAVRAD